MHMRVCVDNMFDITVGVHHLDNQEINLAETATSPNDCAHASLPLCVCVSLCLCLSVSVSGVSTAISVHAPDNQEIN